jgi:hypothetical protein
MWVVVICYPPIEIGGFKMIDVLIAQDGFNRRYTLFQNLNNAKAEIAKTLLFFFVSI